MKHRGWVRAFGLVLFGRAFRGSFFGFVLWVVLFVVRGLGSCFLVRSFRGSFFGSFFGFVLLFVLFGRALGARMCFFRCFKILRGVCGKVRGF